MQYPEWKKLVSDVDGLRHSYICENGYVQNNELPDLTERCVENIERLTRKIDAVERAARETDTVVGSYVLLGVTQGLSYEVIRAKYDVPCCKGAYYELYRKFFWLLDKKKE